jgi:alkylation response protein AidB-like acyl-CoA dehydrogenase
MNFDFNEKEQTFFNEIKELMQGLEKESNIEKNDLAQLKKNIFNALDNLKKTPYLKLCIDESTEVKGIIVLLKAMEIVASVSPSLFLSVETSTRLFGRILSTWGNDGQKEICLNPILDGKALGAVGFCEDTMNVENESLKTKGKIDRNTVVVNGNKNYVINGPIADWIAIVGTLEDKPAVFLVKKDTKGLIIEDRISTLGYERAALSSLSLDQCKIPIDQVLRPQKGENILNAIRQWENQIIMGGSLGLMKGSFESARTYAKAHKTGAKPIIAYQEIGFKLSEMLTLYQTSQLFAFRSAWTYEKDQKQGDSLIDCAKVFCTEAAENVSSMALQILSGEGLLYGNVAEQAYRCSKFGQIAGRSTELSRVRIGDHALGVRH